jgi:Uma2 family endonuclease
MTATPTQVEEKAGEIVLHFSPILKKMGERGFFDLCMLNRDIDLELTSEGDLIITPPTGGKTGRRNSNLNFAVTGWAKKDGTGQYFDSSTMFALPNGAKRSPDSSWVKNERWDALSDEEQEQFPPLCPDFVVELRSQSDSLKRLQEKMEEYIANGAQLGWLLDPSARRVYVYRPGAEVEVLEDPETVSGEPLLRGFTLDVRALWE